MGVSTRQSNIALIVESKSNSCESLQCAIADSSVSERDVEHKVDKSIRRVVDVADDEST